MREILFKAKAINRDKGYHRSSYKNGDWVYGLITRLYNERFENLPAEMTDENGVSGIEIDHNTICQYTGLTDKNGNKIWENDVIYARCNGLSGYGVVKYEKGCFVLKDSKRDRIYSLFGEWTFRVDGNIFDNTELLGGGKA